VDRLNRHAVQATIARDSSIAGWPYEKPYSTAVRWQFEGVVHNDEWRSSDWRKAGEVQSIWTTPTATELSH